MTPVMPIDHRQPSEPPRNPASTGQAEGGRSRPEVAPPAVDALGGADLTGREPLRHHADADHEPGAHDRQGQPAEQQGLEVLEARAKIVLGTTANIRMPA
jgi:hypothetical protein